MLASGLTLLLVVVGQLVALPRAGPEEVDNCLIFDTCDDPASKCVEGEKYNPKSDTCDKVAAVVIEPARAAGGADCININKEISEDDFSGDLRTVKDCNRNTTCEDYSDLGFVCVPFWTCRNGVVITDGSGLIDLRSTEEDPDCCAGKNAVLDLSDNKCKTKTNVNAVNHVCCKGPNLRVKPCTITSKCGAAAEEQTKSSTVPFATCGRIVTNTTIRLTGLGVRSADGELDTRSVGGDIAQPGEFPHMCLVYSIFGGKRAYIAGASLIAPNKVLSVAHKFYVNHGKDILDLREEKNVYVRCGEHNVKLKAELLEFQDSRVEQMLFAPEYSDKNVYHDLVILVTKENYVYQDHISPVCLPSPGENFDSYKDCWSTGWGSDVYPEPNLPVFYSDQLRKVKLPMVSNKECFKQLKAHQRFANITSFKLHDSWVCAGGEQQGTDTCKGDGGSPHICRKKDQWVQVGAVNWGIKCGEAVPSVYSSVAADMCWIDWVLSCTPLATQYLDLRVVDTVDLRSTDSAVESVNKLTEKDCGKWRDDHPALIKKCRVDYLGGGEEEADVRSVDRK